MKSVGGSSQGGGGQTERSCRENERCKVMETYKCVISCRALCKLAKRRLYEGVAVPVCCMGLRLGR